MIMLRAHVPCVPGVPYVPMTFPRARRARRVHLPCVPSVSDVPYLPPNTLADLTNFILKGVNRSSKMDHALIFFLPLGWLSYLPSALNSKKSHYFSPMKP